MSTRRSLGSGVHKGPGLTRGRIAIYSVVLVLLASLLLAANARAGARDSSIPPRPELTNATSGGFMVVKAQQAGSRLAQPAQVLAIWRPPSEPLAPRARATITRTFERLEGDTVSPAIFGEPAESDL